MKKNLYLSIAICFYFFGLGCQFHADVRTADQFKQSESALPESSQNPISKNSVLYYIESSASGSGTNYSSLSVSVGTSTDLFSIKRDESGSFIENAAVSWGIVGNVGSINIAADSKSVTFVAGSSPGTSTISLYSDGKLTQQLAVTVGLPPLGTFNITGITAAADNITDDFLSNSTLPTVSWTSSVNATSYEISIFEDDGTSLKCPVQTTTNSSLDMGASCSLTAGQYYKARVVAKLNSDSSLDATNSLYRFYVNRSPVAGTDGLGPWYVKAGGTLVLNVAWAASPGVGVATDPDSHSMSFFSVTTGSLGTTSIGGSGATITYTANSGSTSFGRDTFDAVIKDDKGGTYTATIIVHVMQDYSWTGKLSSAWNTGGNWCGATVAADFRSCAGAASAPGSGSTGLVLYFDNTCASTFTCSPSTTSNISVQGIRITANGFTQSSGHTLTVGSSGWSMTGGQFNGGNSLVSISSSTTAIGLSITGGTFNSTAGVLEILRFNATYAGFQLGAAGNFVHQNGTVKFQMIDRSGYTLDIDTQANFYNLIYSSNATCCGTYDVTPVYLGSGKKLIVQNDFTMQREGGSASNSVAANGGTIEVHGNIKAINGGGGVGGGTTIVALVGSGNQTYQNSSGGSFPVLQINKTSGTVEPEAGTTSLVVSRFVLTQGSFLAPSGDFVVRSNEASGTNIFDTSAPGTIYSHNNGTLKFLSIGRNGYSIELNSQLNVYNLVYSTDSTCCSPDTRPFTLGSGDKFIVENDLTVRREAGAQGNITLNSGSIDLYGNVYAINGAGGGGSTQVNLVSTGNQTYNASGGGGRLPRIYINKASGNVSAGAGTTDLTVSRLYLLQGVLDAPTGYLTVQSEEANGAVVWNTANGTTFNHNNGTLRFASHSRNSYSIDLNNELQVYNLIYTVTYSCCGGDNRRFTLGAGEKFIVENDFTVKIESGMAGYMGANGGTIDIYGDLIVEAGSNGGTTNINMLGSNNATITQSGGVPPGGTYTLAKSGGAIIDLLTNLNLGSTGQDLVIQSETLRMNGLSLTVQDTLTINPGATLNAGGGVYTPNSLPKLVNGGTIVP